MSSAVYLSNGANKVVIVLSEPDGLAHDCLHTAEAYWASGCIDGPTCQLPGTSYCRINSSDAAMVASTSSGCRSAPTTALW